MAKKASHCEVKRELQQAGVDFSANFHALPSSTVGLIVDGAQRARYRKSKNAPGSRGRMYFQLLQRKGC